MSAVSFYNRPLGGMKTTVSKVVSFGVEMIGRLSRNGSEPVFKPIENNPPITSPAPSTRPEPRPSGPPSRDLPGAPLKPSIGKVAMPKGVGSGSFVGGSSGLGVMVQMLPEIGKLDTLTSDAAEIERIEQAKQTLPTGGQLLGAALRGGWGLLSLGGGDAEMAIADSYLESIRSEGVQPLPLTSPVRIKPVGSDVSTKAVDNYPGPCPFAENRCGGGKQKCGGRAANSRAGGWRFVNGRWRAPVNQRPIGLAR